MLTVTLNHFGSASYRKPVQMSARGLSICRAEYTRRKLNLHSSGLAASSLLLLGDQSLTTIVNSVLGAYGLPKLRNSDAYKQYDDIELGVSFLYPGSWVQRANHQRAGVYISNFDVGSFAEQTADKLVLEIFSRDNDSSISDQLVQHFVNPAQEIGGDARLSIPAARNIRSQDIQRDGQGYTVVEFPSETITRSGYNIKRKNIGVACIEGQQVYTLVASARSDQYNPEKKALFQGMVESFRVSS